MSGRGAAGSEYLRWAKTAAEARFNLTSSGVPYLPLAALPAPEHLELSGSGGYGYEPLQRAIADRYGVALECCVAAQGCSMANHLAMAAVLRPGDEVLIEQPTYDPLVAVAGYLGASVRFFPRRADRGFIVDPAEVQRCAGPRTRLIVLTNLHNPSGAETPEESLRELGEVARRVGARVLVDEVYLDAVWDRPPRTAFSLGPEFIATSSLTKVYGLNGLRCGWVFAEPALAHHMWRLTEIFNNIGAHPAECLSLAAMRHLPAIASRSRALLDANAAALNAFFATRRELDWIPHRHGTVSFPRLLSGDVDSLWKLLRVKYETSVVPGRFFGAPAHFRIGLGVPPDVFAGGLERLGSALDVLG